MVFSVAAVQPNYVETTIYNVDGAGSDVVSTDYSDGLGRPIQTKLKLADDRDRVACTYYNDVGRKEIETKPFVDSIQAGSYLPGDITATDVAEQLGAKYQHDDHAYYETKYWDDPSGTPKQVLPPGRNNDVAENNQNIYTRSWTIGVDSSMASQNVPVSATINDTAVEGTVVFAFGLVTSMTITAGSVELMFDALYDLFLSDNPFNEPEHFLTINLDPEGNISEQMDNVLGQTQITYLGPAISGIVNRNSLAVSSKYEYDVSGNVLKEIPPESGYSSILDNTTYLYNTLGQVISKRSPDIDGEINYDYNDDGSIHRQTHTVNYSTVSYIEYEYDDLGRQTTILQGIPPSINRNVVEYYYDDAENIPVDIYKSRLSQVLRDNLTNLKGRLACSVAHNYGTTDIRVINVFSYNDEGNLRYKTTIIDGNPIVQSTWYEYDIHDNVTADYCFYGSVIVKKVYTYDNLGRLKSIKHSKLQPDGSITGEPTLAEYSYNDLGEMESKKFNRIDENYLVSYQRNLLDRVTAMRTPSSFKGFSETISEYLETGNIKNASYAYVFNPASGNDEDRVTYGMTYKYDGQSRLNEVTSSYEPEKFNSQYDYDKIGRFNRKIEKSDTLDRYEYYGATNRLKQTSKTVSPSYQYVYTSSGNLLFDFKKNMMIVYDWRNLPREFRFYDHLVSAVIQKKPETGMLTMSQLTSMLVNNKIKLVSKVVMLYDAGSNRVCKMDVKE